ncbi:MAG: glycosyltransferase, partial [Alphaproteobacteria bacterium]|nr:glycosyltransferase [Alphaproteobacteria bacterium]
MIDTCVASSGGALVPLLEKLGGIHITMPLDQKNPLALLRNKALITQAAKDHKIDLIHARSRAPGWSALWAARTLGIPLITTYHGVYNSTGRIKRFYNSIMARGDHVIAISHYIARHIEKEHGHLKPKISIIPEGIDTDSFDPLLVSAGQINQLKSDWEIPKENFVILLPGRLTRWKGQEILLKALEF